MNSTEEAMQDQTTGGPQDPEVGRMPFPDDIMHSARIAGLKDFHTPTLEQVERRRIELLGVVFFLVIGLALTAVLLSTAQIEVPDWLEQVGATATVIRVLVVGLAVSVSVYVWEKERHLAKLSRSLVNERVLSAALSNRLKEISLLTEAGKAVVSHLELDEVLNVILNAASDLLEADEGSVMLLDAEELVVAAATGHAVSFVGGRSSVQQGLAGYVARTREPLLVEGRPDASDFEGRLPPREERITAAVLVPLVAKGELLGILNLNVIMGDRRFNEYDLRALSLFGEHAAMAIRHARTLRKEREMRLRIAELDRIRTELVGTMTHDLKTPLTTILGSSKMLLQRFDEIDSVERTKILGSIERQSDRLLHLIDRLLEASRSQAEYPLSTGLLDLVAQIEPLVRAYATAHDRPVIVEKEANRVSAMADPEAVEQIVANLLENAVRHTPEGTAIRVIIAPRGAVAEVTVADDGPGIPVEERERLFEPFHRGARPPTAGAGLGLFIVSNLVNAMGGNVSVGGAPGGGASFTFTLPAEGSARTGETPPAPSAVPDDGGESM